MEGKNVQFGVVVASLVLLLCVQYSPVRYATLVVLAFVTFGFLLQHWLRGIPQVQVSSEGKAVFLTGCDTGFGFEAACHLDSAGFKVFAGCLLPAGEGATGLKELCSGRLEVLPLDVTKDESVQQALETITAKLPHEGLWAVVNNAGISCTAEFELTTMETVRSLFEVNIIGIIRVTKAFLPLLRASRGRLVIVSSKLGRAACPGIVGYSMTKYAAVAFAEGLRLELCKWGISVTLVEPGLYKTPIASEKNVFRITEQNWWATCPSIREAYGQNYLEKFRKKLQRNLALARPYPEEVANCICKAVGDYYPWPSYQPGNLYEHFFMLGAIFLPTSLQVAFYKSPLKRLHTWLDLCSCNITAS